MIDGLGFWIWVVGLRVSGLGFRSVIAAADKLQRTVERVGKRRREGVRHIELDCRTGPRDRGLAFRACILWVESSGHASPGFGAVGCRGFPFGTL